MRGPLCAPLCNCRHTLRAGDDEGLFEVPFVIQRSPIEVGKEAISFDG